MIFRSVRIAAKWLLHRLMPVRYIASKILPLDALALGLGRTPRPTGWTTVTDYFASQPVNDRWLELYPAEDVTYTSLPDTGQYIPDLLRSPPCETVPSAGLALLNDCRYWGHYAGTVIASNDLMIEEFSREVFAVPHNKGFHIAGLPRPESLKGTTAVLTSRGAENNYYHWTVDLLPRIHLLQKYLGDLSSIDWFLINHRSKPYQLECLSDLGVPIEKVIVPSANTHLRLERAIIPSAKLSHGPVSTWTLEFLSSLQTASTELGERIYLSRKGEVGRCVKNEEDVWNLLQSQGYQRVYAEDYTVHQQRGIFKNAQSIVAIHGAGLTNCAWSSPGTKVAELMSPTYIDLSFRRMLSQRQAIHSVILGEGKVSSSTSQLLYRTDSFKVPLEYLKSFLSN